MSARLETQTGLKDSTRADLGGTFPSEIEVQSLFRNFEARNLVAPLRKMHSGKGESKALAEQERQTALGLQDQWEALLVRREFLGGELKRGGELLEQTRKELRALRGRLEDWAAYERVCGKNPVLGYMEAIGGHERVQRFLPGWLKRRQSQLRQVNQQLDRWARQNQLEHLL